MRLSLIILTKVIMPYNNKVSKKILKAIFKKEPSNFCVQEFRDILQVLYIREKARPKRKNAKKVRKNGIFFHT